MKEIRRPLSMLLSAALVLSLFGCGAPRGSGSPSAGGASADAAKAVGTPWIDANVKGVVTKDTQTDVHEDYFVAEAKDWLAETKIPEDLDSWGSFSERERQIEDSLIVLVEDPGKTDHDVECLRNYYALLGDQDARDAAGIEPLAADVRRVQSIATIDELTAYLTSDAERLRGGYLAGDDDMSTGETLVTLGIAIDDVGTTDYRVSVGTNSFFLETEASTGLSGEDLAQLNAPFLDKVTYMLGRLGYTKEEARRQVALVRRLEGRLEKPTLVTPEQEKAAEQYLEGATAGAADGSVDWGAIDEQYARYLDHTVTMTREQMAATAGAFPILSLLDAWGLGEAHSFDVAEPLWLAEMGSVYTQENLEALKCHVIFGLLIDNMGYLDSDAAQVAADNDNLKAALDYELEEQSEADAADSGGAGSGDSADAGAGSVGADVEITDADELIKSEYIEPVSEEQSAKRELISTVMQDLPGVATNAFVRHCYPASANERAVEITNQIIAKYRELLATEDWLDPETRQKAIEKLEAVELHVGFPSSLDDTDMLSVPAPASGATAYDAVKTARAFNVNVTQKVLADPSEGTYWRDPMDVNAYYSQQENAIFVGCGIIGGRLFDESAPAEEQLATLGHTVGHELTHAFDDAGALYDKDGNRTNWWTDGDRRDFSERTAKVVSYLEGVRPFGQTGYDGVATCGEMIADMGGLKAALLVAKDIDGFDYQRFFKAYTIGWQSVGSAASAKDQFLTDTHPLDATRANVSVMQVQEFYDTYGIKPGDTMFQAPEDRISVW
ncbi:MAG: M13 family metallopeptidase [Olsenella sp.]|nr:M13 family metallopeptidase [Olsenella sp.]